MEVASCMFIWALHCVKLIEFFTGSGPPSPRLVHVLE